MPWENNQQLPVLFVFYSRILVYEHSPQTEVPLVPVVHMDT